MFNNLMQLPTDPLLGLIERFREDANPQKIDLGVGVYKNEVGETPVQQCVKLAEKFLLENESTKAYLGPMGDQLFAESMLKLAFGENHACLLDGRVAAKQTPGGCGALRVTAELIVRASPSARVWVSNPSWANHTPLLGNAGVKFETYPYYNFVDKGISFDEMISTLDAGAKAGDLVLLHGCCHNPCGADLNHDQWQAVAELLKRKQLIPFVDMAYQGLAEGIEEDAYGIRLLADTLPEMLLALSCSKSFGLYRERTGLAVALTESKRNRDIANSNMVNIARGIYSMPPSHGAATVTHILRNPHLEALWRKELGEQRERICYVREMFVDIMAQRGYGERFDFIGRERGMFSFLGLNLEQVQRMINSCSVYMTDSSRISLAGLNNENIDYFCDSVVATLEAG
ncbi:MAG: aromatic amino acid aminotransferase [Alteromonadaceae bacterium]|nr:MAG: aromatic amino acid aminotransferase [Alteromonadaceae bacterium]